MAVPPFAANRNKPNVDRDRYLDFYNKILALLESNLFQLFSMYILSTLLLYISSAETWLSDSPSSKNFFPKYISF
jgi:hypothetical protein